MAKLKDMKFEGINHTHKKLRNSNQSLPKYQSYEYGTHLTVRTNSALATKPQDGVDCKKLRYLIMVNSS